jgi:4-amino-4-deoxy-L-arabinose transferase-like glycosyltransferase
MRKEAALQRVHSARGLWLAARGTLAPLAPPLLLGAAVYLGLFFQLGAFPLFDVDEGAFSEATREMLARGDYVTTWLNGELRFDKPILIYWLQAASVALFGVDEFAFRLPSALASSGWIGAIFVFARRQLGQADAYAAALIAATTLGVCVVGRGAIADALLNMFLALAMFDIYRYLAQPRALYRYRAFLWIGLGLLTKGPVALLVPFAASGAAFALQGQWRAWLRAAFDPLGWLLLAAVAGPWYVLEYLRQGDAFVAGFFLRHNVERFMSPLQGHSGNVLYYVPVVLLVLLPFTGLFLRVLPRLARLRADPLDCFLWCWFLFVFVFFSFAGTKLPHYLLYGVTPLFVLMARHRELLAARRVATRLLALLPPILLLGLVVALPHALERFGPRTRNLYFRDMLTRVEVFGPGWQLAGSALLLVGLALALAPRLALWPRLVGCAFLCSLAVGALALPAVAELQQGPVKEAALIARAQKLQVRTWHFNVPSFSVYRGAVTERASTLRAGDVILTRSDELLKLGRVQVLYRKGGVVLARIPS